MSCSSCAGGGSLQILHCSAQDPGDSERKTHDPRLDPKYSGPAPQDTTFHSVSVCLSRVRTLRQSLRGLSQGHRLTPLYQSSSLLPPLDHLLSSVWVGPFLNVVATFHMSNASRFNRGSVAISRDLSTFWTLESFTWASLGNLVVYSSRLTLGLAYLLTGLYTAFSKPKRRHLASGRLPIRHSDDFQKLRCEKETRPADSICSPRTLATYQTPHLILRPPFNVSRKFTKGSKPSQPSPKASKLSISVSEARPVNPALAIQLLLKAWCESGRGGLAQSAVFLCLHL